MTTLSGAKPYVARADEKWKPRSYFRRGEGGRKGERLLEQILWSSRFRGCETNVLRCSVAQMSAPWRQGAFKDRGNTGLDHVNTYLWRVNVETAVSFLCVCVRARAYARFMTKIGIFGRKEGRRLKIERKKRRGKKNNNRQIDVIQLIRLTYCRSNECLPWRGREFRDEKSVQVFGVKIKAGNKDRDFIFFKYRRAWSHFPPLSPFFSPHPHLANSECNLVLWFCIHLLRFSIILHLFLHLEKDI